MWTKATILYFNRRKHSTLKRSSFFQTDNTLFLLIFTKENSFKRLDHIIPKNYSSKSGRKKHKKSKEVLMRNCIMKYKIIYATTLLFLFSKTTHMLLELTCLCFYDLKNWDQCFWKWYCLRSKVGFIQSSWALERMNGKITKVRKGSCFSMARVQVTGCRKRKSNFWHLGQNQSI